MMLSQNISFDIPLRRGTETYCRSNTYSEYTTVIIKNKIRNGTGAIKIWRPSGGKWQKLIPKLSEKNTNKYLIELSFVQVLCISFLYVYFISF